MDRYLKKSPLGWISAQIRLRKGDIAVKRTNGEIVNRRDYRFTEGDTLLIADELIDKFSACEKKLDISPITSNRILEPHIIYEN